MGRYFGIINAFKKVFGGDSVGNTVAKGEVFHDNVTHLKMFGKDIDVLPTINGANLNIPHKDGGFVSIGMSIQEYECFSKLDESQQKEFIKNFLKEKHPDVLKELSDSYLVGMYHGGPNKKFHVGLNASELERMESLKPEERNKFFRELLREKDPQQYKALIATEKALRADSHTRNITQTPWQRDGSPSVSSREQRMGWQGNFKQYPDEPLNPRIRDVRAFVDRDEINLHMTVDGKEKILNIRNKSTVDAYNAGAIPDNVLANRVLNFHDGLYANLASRFEMKMGESQSQDQVNQLNR